MMCLKRISAESCGLDTRAWCSFGVYTRVRAFVDTWSDYIGRPFSMMTDTLTTINTASARTPRHDDARLTPG
jgi:hypothetical protein